MSPTRSLAAAALASAALLTTALSLATPEIMRWEGRRTAPYRDMAGVPTVCYGDTRVPMRRYGVAECEAMLRRRVEVGYARPILACVPRLARRPYAFAASISLAYNIGPAAFCRSLSAQRFRRGDWRGGCEAMRGWTRVGGRDVPGLVRRRESERALCLRGAA